MNTIALRGFGRLVADGVVGVSHIAEALQTAIVERIPLPPIAPQAVSGFAGLIHRTVRGTARGIGHGLDKLLQAATPARWHGDGDAGMRRLRAIVNGVLGDHLRASGNPLAIPMRLRFDGKPLEITHEQLAALPTATAPRILLIVHGLCMAPDQWQRNGHDHGAAIAEEFGWLPIHLEYNSGLHVSQNAREMSALLQQLFDAWPVEIERFAILAHSMGGLIARSALHQAQAAGMDWCNRLDDLVFLGTPHHGAPLERVGHGVDRLLGASPYSAPFAMLGTTRSAGIVDLRRGDLLESDWRDGHANPRTPIPLPAGVRCRAVAAALHEPASKRARHWIGDGLVPLSSALGEHPEPEHALNLPPSSQLVVDDAGHFDLLDDARVYQQLRVWLDPGIAPKRRRRSIRG